MAGFRYAHAYPLKDLERYDDDYGIGYTHALVATPFCNEMYVCDCWIVDAEGNRHPGYADTPIPIQRADLDLENGVYLGIEYEPAPIFEAFGCPTP